MTEFWNPTGSKAAAAPATSSPLLYLPGGRTWPVRDMARSAIVEYIAWHNGTLLHSTLGYRSPPNSNKETRSRSSLTESSALSVKAEQPQDATAEVPDSGMTARLATKISRSAAVSGNGRRSASARAFRRHAGHNAAGRRQRPVPVAAHR